MKSSRFCFESHLEVVSEHNYIPQHPFKTPLCDKWIRDNISFYFKDCHLHWVRKLAVTSAGSSMAFLGERFTGSSIGVLRTIKEFVSSTTFNPLKNVLNLNGHQPLITV